MKLKNIDSGNLHENTNCMQKKKQRKMYISIYIQVSLGVCVNHTMGVSVLCREKLDQQGILIIHRMWKYTVCILCK